MHATAELHRIISGTLFLVCMMWCVLAYANDPITSDTRVIRITGAISSQTLSKLNADLAGFRNSDPVPAGLVVLLNSPGGDGDIAMQMGRLLRKHRAHVMALHQCDSACAILLMGGVVRAAISGAIGVHAGRLTVMADNGSVIREIDANRNLGHAFQLATYNRDIRQYIHEMGIDHALLDLMLAHPAPDVYKLNASELRRYQLTGFNEDYLNKRTLELNSNPWTHPITRTELFKRTMSVPDRCHRTESSNTQFIACYRWTLIRH